MSPLLVADIGGTNARFALALGHGGQALQLTNQQEFACADFSCFNDVLAYYLRAVPEKNVKRAAIAIAGPVADDFAKMTNLDWEVSGAEIKKRFAFTSIIFVNDLAAHALATINLDKNYFERLKPGTVQTRATRAIIGPGTGLGVASLNWHSDGWRAYPTEGGHIAFAPGNDIEREIHNLLHRQHGYVSLEMLLSGPGLLNIYHSLATIQGRDVRLNNAKAILQHCDRDELSQQCVDIFVGALGSSAGDIALAYGAKGGLFLGGGMTRHLLPFIRKPGFVDRFMQKGFRNEYLASIPIDAILYPTPGLLGAALWYYQHTNALTSALE